jgi:multiple sugar transport system ATP-binding protein
LYPHMSVRENISFGLKIRKFDKSEIDRRVEEAAGKLGLTEFLERKPKALSGGQRQRVAIGRAIVRSPHVFLFDEPLSNLDAKLRGQMRIRIAKLHNELKTTAVYVTHDQIEAMTLASRIIVLNQGKIQQEGHPLELYERPKNRFVATFIGSPSMNMIDGRFESQNGKVRFSSKGGLNFMFNDNLTQQLNGARENRDITWGLRPECLAISKNSESSDLEGVVEVVEPLGSSTSVICNIGGEEVQVTLKDAALPRVGEKVPLRYVGSRLYAFDSKTGLNICH